MEGRTLLRDQAAPSASAPTGRSASQATGDEAAAEVGERAPPPQPQLSKRSCVSCNSKDLQAMSEDSAKTLLEQVTGWEVKNEGDILKLHRAWKVKSFAKGLEFFQLVAAVAEEEGHHPDLHLVGWNNVKIDVWTHSVSGLTDNDFILAAKINELKLGGLLSKKKSTAQE
ncbi:pterin-4-alpha-carbinolamine dehydratase 2, mitochondrial isoform X1 [Triticum aestivum]|uniref:pterin-4-alpha-carbinolamine dehydratase 2, mitochondrial isoform X1 n=1 Tax=Triticum aestivum TaxID=4565 RepID=UPI001D026D50|nr:pterin-4-alpha-carbinolamine dehydratase 2, mitochondrial-like isoform X1 [Triticum aestivum]